MQVEGSVKLGNRTLTADDLDYVPQFDDLNEFFTVSTLTTANTTAAQFRCHNAW
jgi:hypothetical protein